MAFALCPPTQSLEAQTSCTSEAGNGKEPGYPSSGPGAASLSLDCFLGEKNKPRFCFLCFLLPGVDAILPSMTFCFSPMEGVGSESWRNLSKANHSPETLGVWPWTRSVSISQEWLDTQSSGLHTSPTISESVPTSSPTDWRVLWFEKYWPGQSIIESGFDPRPVCF